MNNENLGKMNINWYPGHMAKTRRQIEEDLKLIDVVVELLDARIPMSSRNPDINEIIKGKKRVIVLNKSDLADEKETKQWVEYFKTKNQVAIITDANSGRGMDAVIRAIENMMKQDLEENASKGRVGRSIRVLVLGIPNVGKSSFINRIAKKTSAQVGNKPGVTKKKQWIRVANHIELLDTPGVLWPKFESEEVGLHLAYTGTIKDDILERTEVAYYLLKFLLENNREAVCSRYTMTQEEVEEVLSQEQEENENIYEIMQKIARKRGAIVSGGNIDDEKIANILLDDYRSGRLGRITIEKVEN